MKCTAYSRAERSSPADGVSSCKQSPRLSLSSAAPLKKHDVGRVFFNVCKVFCTHLHNFFEIVRGACRLRSRLPLASNFNLFTCRQQLYGLFCHRRLSAAVLLVLVFQLYNIVDFPLIHRPYGFIVQFLMINTGNGGSFVQL